MSPVSGIFFCISPLIQEFIGFKEIWFNYIILFFPHISVSCGAVINGGTLSGFYMKKRLAVTKSRQMKEIASFLDAANRFLATTSRA